MKKAMRSMECLVEDSDNDNEEEEEDHGDQEGVPPEAWRSVKDEATGRTYIYTYIYCLHEDERVCLGEIGSNRRIRFLPHGLLSFSCVNNACA